MPSAPRSTASKPALLPYYAQTMPGVEQIAWLEAHQRFPGARLKEYLFAKERNGILVFDYDGSAESLLELRTVEDVFLLALSSEIASRGRGALQEVTRAIEADPLFGQAVHVFSKLRGRASRLTYRVVTRMEGQHQFRRVDVEQAVLKGLGRRLGDTWLLVEEDANLEVWTNLLGGRLLCGLRLSDRTMRHRAYQTAHLPTSLRPSVAAAMVFLTTPDEHDTFLDPMCGSGTLLAERMLVGKYQQALGGDSVARHVETARKNLAGLGGHWRVSRWDARKLPLASESIDAVATNPPFGKQIGSRNEVEQLYPAFLAELARVLKRGGRAVILSSQYELLKAAVRQQSSLQIVRGYSVAVLGEWGRIYLLQKDGLKKDERSYI
ncbi:MAG TPA: methyltransferase domain-containing protein [Ktedonobacterales bacterium]|jgi:23S rRNA G2445 N2-methylase RlmL